MSCDASRKTAHETNRIRMTILALDRLQIADWSSTTHQIRNCSSSSRHAKRDIGTSLVEPPKPSVIIQQCEKSSSAKNKKIARRRFPYLRLNRDQGPMN